MRDVNARNPPRRQKHKGKLTLSEKNARRQRTNLTVDHDLSKSVGWQNPFGLWNCFGSLERSISLRRCPLSRCILTPSPPTSLLSTLPRSPLPPKIIEKHCFVNGCLKFLVCALLATCKLQDGASKPRVCLRMPPRALQESPKVAQDGPRWAQDDPSWAQLGPKMPQHRAKMGPR